MKGNKSMNIRSAALLLLLGLGVSCSTTYQIHHAETSGFLGDYSQLRKGQDQEPQLIYFNPDADILQYDKIMIDPIVAYTGADSHLNKVSKENLQALLNYFHATLREQLGMDYELVDKPAPGVLRLRVALTDAQGSKVVMDTLSSVVPVGLAVSALERVAFGKTATTGFVRIEAEALDPMTGTQLAAMVDERAGSKVTGKFDKWNKWQDARNAFDYWAWHLRISLENFRARADSKTAGISEDSPVKQ